MSLMPKLSAILLICASLYGATDGEVIAFLKKGISNNSNINNVAVQVNGKQNVSDLKGWQAYFVTIEADVKQGTATNHVSQNSTYFVNGDIVAPELVNIKTGERYNDTIVPDFNPANYIKSNLISGSASSTYKVAIFSDPLCPFCRRYVPEAIGYMAKYPKTFAVYYYHFPLPTLHPAATALTKAAIAAEQNGEHNVTLRLYQVNIDANEKDEQKILDAFNRTFKTRIGLADIRRPSVLKQFEFDQKVAQSVLVAGTPTVFFDGKKDPKKNKYKEVKAK